MEVRTYSRARAAIAAAKKDLGHLEAFISRWDGVPRGDKFTCEVTVRSGGGKEIADAVMAAGFIPNVTMVAASVDELFDAAPDADEEIEDLSSDEDMTQDNTADEANAEADEIIEAGGDPLPTDAPRKKGGYINEHSNVMGACELARSIAQSMPDAPRKEVIAACRQAGIAYGTARTQLQKVRGGK